MPIAIAQAFIAQGCRCVPECLSPSSAARFGRVLPGFHEVTRQAKLSLRPSVIAASERDAVE